MTVEDDLWAEVGSAGELILQGERLKAEGRRRRDLAHAKVYEHLRANGCTQAQAVRTIRDRLHDRFGREAPIVGGVSESSIITAVRLEQRVRQQ